MTPAQMARVLRAGEDAAEHLPGHTPQPVLLALVLRRMAAEAETIDRETR